MKMLLNLKLLVVFILFFATAALQPTRAAEPVPMVLVAETTNAVVFIVTTPNNKPTVVDEGVTYGEAVQINIGGERIGAINRSAVVVTCETKGLKSALINTTEKGETTVSNTPEEVADVLIQRDFTPTKEGTAGRRIADYMCGFASTEPSVRKRNNSTLVPL